MSLDDNDYYHYYYYKIISGSTPSNSILPKYNKVMFGETLLHIFHWIIKEGGKAKEYPYLKLFETY